MNSRAPLFTSSELASWTGAEYFGNADVCITNVVIDSRECAPGTLFVPLPGENTDGHNFLEKAFENGTSGAFVSEAWAAEAGMPELPEGCFVLKVPDPLTALQAASAAYLGRIKHPVRIGVTGSNGKTTTKELIASVLERKYSVVKTAGNFNSEIGLPLTVFNIREDHDYAVIEMGVNRVGEMDVLTEILRPDIVVITNIGTAHIGIFKTRDAIAAEKRRSASLLGPDGVLFIDEDGEYRDFLSENTGGRVRLFGKDSFSAAGHSFSAESRGLSGWSVRIDGRETDFPLIGEHNLKNALCALAVGEWAGVSPLEGALALEAAEPLFGRGQIISGAATVIVDCYNANADSLLGSIKFADDLEWAGARKYVIGDMKELGESSLGVHEAAGRASASGAASEVYFYGEDAAAAFRAAEETVASAGKGPELFWSEDFGEIQGRLVSGLSDGDLVLLKGSRSMNLERLVEPIVNFNRGKRC